MRKTIFISGVLFLLLAFTSCQPESIKLNGENILTEGSGVEAMVYLSSSDYEKEIREELKQPDENSPYSSGIIDYLEGTKVSATVDFSKINHGKAQCTDKDGERDIDLIWDEEEEEEEEEHGDKDNDKKGKKGKAKYKVKKVVTDPFVKASDCGYIIEGTLKIFVNGEWIATFDYGDGTCDPFVSKSTKDGNSTFSLDDYPEWN